MGCAESLAGAYTRPELLCGTEPIPHFVRLAVTPLGQTYAGLPEAYHTSISVDDLELSFGALGVRIAPNFASHKNTLIGGMGFIVGPEMVMDLGYSSVNSMQVLQALRPYFGPGTYDLIRKNCNTFSDCALWYLLGGRLDKKYARLESIAQAAEVFGLVQHLACYSPNPNCVNFQKDDLIDHLSKMTGHYPIVQLAY